MNTPTRSAGVIHTARRAVLAALLATTSLVASSFASAQPVYQCEKSDCERTAGGLGRSVKAAPAAKPLPVVKPLPVLRQPWAIAQSASGYVIVVDPWGNVFTGPAGGGAEAPEYRENLQKIKKQGAVLQPRHYSVALGGANGERAMVVDNHGHVYAGPIRPPVAFAQVARAVRLQGGRAPGDCDNKNCD